MSIASGSRVRLSYVPEITMGTTPGSPSMKTLRATSRSIMPNINTLESAEVRSDRQKADVRHGFAQVAGTPGFELSTSSYDDFLEAALSGTWAVIPDATTIAVATTTTFTRASGSFVTDGYRPGDIVKSVGFSTSGNNGTWRVTAVVAATLTVDGPLVAEVSGAGKNIQYPGKRLDIGTTLRTFTIERAFLDVTLYQVFKGVAINQMTLNIRPEAIVNGTFGLVGMDPLTAMSGSSLGAPAAAPTNSPYDSFNGSIYEGGVAIAVCTGLDVTLDNGRSVTGVVGSRISPEVFEGQAKVSGNLSAFFSTAALFNKFINETESSIWNKLNDPNGTDFMNIVMPRIKYNGDPIEPPAEGPIIQALPWQALVHATYGTTMWIQRSNAA